MPDVGDTHIQFKPDQQYQRVKINQQHEDEDRTNGAVQFIIIWKIIYPIGKENREQKHQGGGQYTTGIDQFPSLVNKWGITIDKRNGAKE